MKSTLGSPYVFADLDGCLIFSKDGSYQPHVLATNSSGVALSFADDKQIDFLNSLIKMGELVPTTARSSRSYHQVELGHTGWAIVSHGAIILQPDGQPETRWLERTAALVEAERNNFECILANLKRNSALLAIEAGPRIVQDYDLPIFIKASVDKYSGISLTSLLNALKEQLGEHLAGWRFADYDYYIEMVPPYSRKEFAVQWFLDNIADQNRSFTIGMGDMLTDLGFATICDYFISPTQSQIVKSLN